MSVQTKKILRDLSVNKARSLLIILAVAVGVAAFGLMLSGRIVLEENLSTVYRDTHPAHTILTVSPFDDPLLKNVRAMKEVAAADAWRVDLARIQSGPDTWLSFEIQTLPDFDFLTLNKLTSEGTLTAPTLHSILLERSLRNVMQVGEAITIELLNGDSYTLIVAGFVNDLSRLPSEISLAGIGYITPETAKKLDLDLRQYNQLAVRFVEDAATRADIERQTTKLIQEIEDAGY